MKIAVDARPLVGKRTGVGNYLFNILCQWEEMGIMDTVFLYANAKFTWPYTNSRWVIRKWSPLLIRLPNSFRNQIMPMTYYGLAAMKDGADIFWSAQPKSPFFLPIKTAVTVHDFAYKFFPDTMDEYNKRVYNFFADKSIAKADVLFAVSKSTSKDLQKFFPNKQNIVLSENAVGEQLAPSLDLYEARIQLQECYGLRMPYILSVSTLEPRKNLEGLIQAYKIFINETNAPHKLVIVGMDGWKTDVIFSHVKDLGIVDKVIFPGYIPDNDLAMFYVCANFFIFPSLYEGFGVPPLEAMACGCPVIVSARQAMQEVVGDAALLVDPEDPQDIANKMKMLLEDKNLVSTLRAKGLQRVKAYSWRRTAQAVHEALIRSTKRKGP